jgi:hypothetical protein
MATLSRLELDRLVEEATVDAHDEDEQEMGLYTAVQEFLGVPFTTTVLGVEVSVVDVDLVPAHGIVAVCTRGAHRQAVGLLDLPLPAPEPEGVQWIAAYRHWAR